MEHRAFLGSPSVIFLCQEPSFTAGVFALAHSSIYRAEVLQMGPARKTDAEEERLAALEEMGLQEKALIYDEAGDKIMVSGDIAAMRDFYARAFQEWSLGNVEGTAEEIFDAVTSLIGGG
jgi:hypothetical protein